MKLLVICAAVIACGFGASPEVDPYVSWRIVGGRDALLKEVPYIASLQQNQSHRCGAVIVHPLYLLTAAHCVDGTIAETLRVVVGSNTLNPTGNSYNVSSYKMHELYGSNGYVYDIAVLRISVSIKLEAGRIETRPLCKSEENIDPVDCLLSGWGRLSASGPIPNKLQVLDLKSITNAECQNHWGNMVHASNICTLTRAGQGACFGDSGGPLVRQNSTPGCQCVLGLVNWGNPCANGRPDVFVRVCYFRAWISINTKGAV